jgi:hypothetical protein
MIDENLITSLQYISEVKKQLPDELIKMAEKLNIIKEDITEILENNKGKQGEIIILLLEIKTKLKDFAETINNQQSLLQNKIIFVIEKLKKLDENMTQQEVEISPIVKALNNYFVKFEQQLNTLKSKYLELLTQGINTFNQLWQTLDENNEKIENSWLEMTQEVEILNDKMSSFQNLIQSENDHIKDNLDNTENSIDNHIENILSEELNSLTITFKEEINNSLENIENPITEFQEINQGKVEEFSSLVKEKMNTFIEDIDNSIRLDNYNQDLQESHDLFSDNGEDLKELIPKLKKLISDMEEAKKCLNI